MNPLHPTALKSALQHCGLVAILRSVLPGEVLAIGQALYSAGFRVIEVPLNAPDPLESIRILRHVLPSDCVVGAGTVTTAEAWHQAYPSKRS